MCWQSGCKCLMDVGHWGQSVSVINVYLSLCSSAGRRVLQSCQIVIMSKCLTGVPLMSNFGWDCEGFLSGFIARSFPKPKWLVPVGCGHSLFEKQGIMEMFGWRANGHLRTQKGFLTAWLSHSPFLGWQQSLELGNPSLCGLLVSNSLDGAMVLSSAVIQPAFGHPSQRSCKH